MIYLLQCWKPYAVIYGLELLNIGIMVPETCWTNGWLINHNCCIRFISQIISNACLLCIPLVLFAWQRTVSQSGIIHPVPSLVLVSSPGGEVLEYECKYRRHGMSPCTRDVSVMRYLDVYEISTRSKVSQWGRTFTLWYKRNISHVENKR